ncbi:phage tail tip fiber protein [Arsenophonus nasoniae]|uniref:Tip attachment protein J central straight fiber domain-containing protein n=1 Tax=Arsenophonus nasoniae TaxID=638 RepID=A0A4P7KS07_9GAMM|nr:DUF1983 domain-containing protein [Arsenophonus nasoniae]QBY42819.1 hypothetical protein ArsFIN_13790 [Arsenophonus nasoniae]
MVKIVYDGVSYDAGMVIGAELKNEKVTTVMGFNAQQFAFYNPSNGKMDLFMYLQDGQVFINEAFINEAGSIALSLSTKYNPKTTYLKNLDSSLMLKTIALR